MKQKTDQTWLNMGVGLLFFAMLVLPLALWKRFGGALPQGGGSGQPALSLSNLVAMVPAARFVDVTESSGLKFVHNTGAYGDKLLPETMGGACAFLDYDNDGDQDILFVNSGPWPGRPESANAAPALVLYQNDGKGHFTDVTKGSGLEKPFYGMGVAVGDYDNDGLVDIFVTAVGESHLFRNLGAGKFAETTATAGVAGQPADWGTSCAWIDYDNDGDLDLFVCNYLQWSREIDLQVDYKLPGIGRAYGRPMAFSGAFSRLYRNDGGGKFTDVSAAAGIQIKNKATGLPMGKSLGVAPVDLDGDGWIDLIVANDTVQNFVFHNERNGTFREIGSTSGLAYDRFGSVRGAMGIDTGRFQDGDTLGISIGNFANEMTALYVSQRDPLLFSDEALNQGIGSASRLYLTFGVFFFDYDLDGWLDLLTVNGHIEPDINRVHPNERYAQPAQLFWNARGAGPNAGFVAVPPEKCGPDLFAPRVGRGSAFADIDGDGDLDVLLTQSGGPAVLLRNDQNLKHHFLRLKLRGKAGNRDAIGAWARIRVGSKLFAQQIMPSRGYLSQSELPVTFGLGAEDHVDDLQITWPNGVREIISRPKVDAVMLVEQK